MAALAAALRARRARALARRAGPCSRSRSTPDAAGPRVVAWDFALLRHRSASSSPARCAWPACCWSSPTSSCPPRSRRCWPPRCRRRRLAIGWGVGALVSVAGLCASFAWDLPTGATIVAAFGGALALDRGGAPAPGGRAAVRRRGLGALRPAAIAVAGAIALAGLLLVLLPGMDHLWLDALEAAVPRPVGRSSRRASAASTQQPRSDRPRRGHARARPARSSTMCSGARARSTRPSRSARPVPGRAREIAAGDRMVLPTLRAHARARQRFWLGVPMIALGLGSAVALAQRRSARRLRVCRVREEHYRGAQLLDREARLLRSARLRRGAPKPGGVGAISGPHINSRPFRAPTSIVGASRGPTSLLTTSCRSCKTRGRSFARAVRPAPSA